ncbi:hypothetical protein GY45DRAFT_719279 [Cubamyces sp. BRFM 1775]|nr:hypothetical protein GY45DRAFT_719279 [Cubamyces sp. BRFM 1775]
MWLYYPSYVVQQPRPVSWPETAWYINFSDPYGPPEYYEPPPPPIPRVCPLPVVDKSEPRPNPAASGKFFAPAARQSSIIRYCPRLDPLLVYASGNSLKPPIAWDMAFHPVTLQVRLGTPARNGAMSWEYFRRCAARLAFQDGGQPLHSLALIINMPSLQTKVKATPGYTLLQNTSTTTTPYVSVWDVLIALYQALQAPADAETCRRLSALEREAANRSANSRTRREARVLSHVGRPLHVVKNVDLLNQGRRFLGIRAAEGKVTVENGQHTGTFVVLIGNS